MASRRALLFPSLVVLPFLAVASLAVACGDPSPLQAGGAETDAGTQPEEDGSAAASDGGVRTGDGGRDAAKPDSGRPDASVGPLPLDESCGFAPVASPDGTAIVFERCDTPRSLVIRNITSNTATVVGAGASSWRRRLQDGLLVYVGGQTRFFGWDGLPKYALPVYVDENNNWRVNVGAGEIRYARQEAVAGSAGTHEERFAFFSSGSATPVLSAQFTAQNPTVPNVVLSADGTYAASIERYASGLTSRLRVAAVAAGAPVTTYELPYFEPRWVPNGVVGGGALFTSQRYLYFADFSSGAVVALSTLPVVADSSKPDRVYAAVAGPYVLFVNGAMRKNGSGAPGSYALQRWDSSAPSTPPATLATGTDYVSPYAENPLTVLPDGATLAYALERPSVAAGTAYHTAPIAGGADRVFANEKGVAFGRPALAMWTDYSVITAVKTRFENLADGTFRELPRAPTAYHDSFSGADGTTFFLFTTIRNDTAKTSSLKLEVGGFSGPMVTLLDMPQSARLFEMNLTTWEPFYRADAAPLVDGIVVRIPRGTPSVVGDLFVYRR